MEDHAFGETLQLASQQVLPERGDDPASPLISVVIPTYNAGEYIEAAIASVLGQTFRDFEIIVVDDGSTDDTGARLAGRPELHYLKLPHQGPSLTRNAGLRLARGEWIAFLDADDIWHPDKLARQVRVARDPRFAGVSLIFSDYNEFRQGRLYRAGAMRQGFPIFTECGFDLPDIFAEKIRVEDFDCYKGQNPVKFFHGNLILPSTALLRRKEFARLGDFDPDYWCAQDTEMFLRWSYQSTFVCLDVPLINYTVGRPGQISRPENLEHKVLMDLQLRRGFLLRHPEFEQRHPAVVNRVFARQLALLGRLQMTRGDILGGRGSLGRARQYEALRGKNALFYLLARLPARLAGLLFRLKEGFKGSRRRVLAQSLPKEQLASRDVGRAGANDLE